VRWSAFSWRRMRLKPRLQRLVTPFTQHNGSHRVIKHSGRVWVRRVWVRRGWVRIGISQLRLQVALIAGCPQFSPYLRPLKIPVKLDWYSVLAHRANANASLQCWRIYSAPWWMARERMERCMREKESFLISSHHHIEMRRRLDLPITRLCPQTSATSLWPGMATRYNAHYKQPIFCSLSSWPVPSRSALSLMVLFQCSFLPVCLESNTV